MSLYKGERELEYLANHYYLPVVYSTRKRLEYIRHIIDVESEVRFLHALREYIQPRNKDCVLRHSIGWMFSKLDQYLDTVFIPYYDPKQNRIARFIPDFIFWGQKGNRYTVLFVDPKGIENQDWERKAEGYVRVFEERGTSRVYKLDANRGRRAFEVFYARPQSDTRGRLQATLGGPCRRALPKGLRLLLMPFRPPSSRALMNPAAVSRKFRSSVDRRKPLPGRRLGQSCPPQSRPAAK